MKRKHGDEEYTSSFIEDRAQGFGGYELLRVQNGKEHRVATVVFWDAMGQYFVETFGDVPLAVLEALIAEARAAIGEKKWRATGKTINPRHAPSVVMDC